MYPKRQKTKVAYHTQGQLVSWHTEPSRQCGKYGKTNEISGAQPDKVYEHRYQIELLVHIGNTIINTKRNKTNLIATYLQYFLSRPQIRLFNRNQQLCYCLNSHCFVLQIAKPDRGPRMWYFNTILKI